tara:strand:+ start:5003 stop:5641 length:639 start_codon:yes stop_codon:yes gene_type:complete
MMRKNLLLILGGIATAILFVLIAQVSQLQSDFLKDMTQQVGVFGIFSYIFLLIVAIVIAPISTGFLLPVAANSWGPLLTALFSLTGWTIGAVIAFVVSRKYGLRWVAHFESVKKMRDIEAAIPRQHVFWFVVLLRMAFPVEVLSYALGIFSTMSLRAFIASTIIGITPFTFLFSYASVGSLWLQILTASLGFGTFAAGAYYVYVHTKKNREG